MEDGKKEVTPSRYGLLGGGYHKNVLELVVSLFKLVHVVKPTDTKFNSVDFLP